MSEIGVQTIGRMADQCRALLTDYQQEINAAYHGMGDDPLTVSLSVKVAPGREGNDIETNISFVTGRIKDRIKSSVNERQMGLFADVAEPRLPLNISCPVVVGKPKLYGRLGW